MPASATTMATTISNVLVVVGRRADDVRSLASTTGCSQCSSRLHRVGRPTPGSWMMPPTIDSPASTTSGRSMIRGRLVRLEVAVGAV